MKISLLEYYKLILIKVSFDRYLLAKEYRKALASLGHEESRDFKKWVESRFQSHPYLAD